ncbi:hypothetical protein ACETRX_05385 [Labrys portucalensis]|uniref:DUF2502 domain-containing protein n=1 Tax=Labrys neptuniae TaxID=376174 RepID=A0ABV6ZA45_9HYPH|nr:hypothetical protein [Labrys neptuniae]MDT3379119.1 hypothetical protein [Labrys neptuniae]
MKKLLLAALIAVGALSASVAPSSALAPVHLGTPAATQAEQVGWHGWGKHGWRRHHDNGLHRGWRRGRHEGWRRHGGRHGHDGWRRHGGRHHRW